MAKIESYITPEELENNYEYKIVKRALMKQYPFIKEVTFDPNELDVYNLIFLNFIVDPIQMGETYGWELTPWVKSAIDDGRKYVGNYPSLLYNVSYEEGKNTMTNVMNDMMQEIHNSPALPDDLVLPKGRMFTTGSFIINPDGPAW